MSSSGHCADLGNHNINRSTLAARSGAALGGAHQPLADPNQCANRNPSVRRSASSEPRCAHVAQIETRCRPDRSVQRRHTEWREGYQGMGKDGMGQVKSRQHVSSPSAPQWLVNAGICERHDLLEWWQKRAQSGSLQWNRSPAFSVRKRWQSKNIIKGQSQFRGEEMSHRRKTTDPEDAVVDILNCALFAFGAGAAVTASRHTFRWTEAFLPSPHPSSQPSSNSATYCTTCGEVTSARKVYAQGRSTLLENDRGAIVFSGSNLATTLRELMETHRATCDPSQIVRLCPTGPSSSNWNSLPNRSENFTPSTDVRPSEQESVVYGCGLSEPNQGHHGRVAPHFQRSSWQLKADCQDKSRSFQHLATSHAVLRSWCAACSERHRKRPHPGQQRPT